MLFSSCWFRASTIPFGSFIWFHRLVLSNYMTQWKLISFLLFLTLYWAFIPSPDFSQRLLTPGGEIKIKPLYTVNTGWLQVVGVKPSGTQKESKSIWTFRASEWVDRMACVYVCVYMYADALKSSLVWFFNAVFGELISILGGIFNVFCSSFLPSSGTWKFFSRTKRTLL